ncbi:Long-chain-fatty-acid--CoA ligase [Hyphomicrobiales bacterium]|nr:Long-chain-fatty-acid--CoA ligase [Hyphomicrobiales bacterium]CAH1690140.1 Long-chain-fatty-acid--CoA ligase [Hyphomicrobiales bacterium]
MMHSNTPSSDVRSGSAKGMIVADGIRAAAGRTPSKTAIIAGERRLTFAALIERIDRVANLAHAGLGLRHGDRAAILSPNCLEYMEIIAGLSSAGVATAAIGPVASGPEIRFICEDSAARVLFVDPALEEKARACVPPSVERIIPLGAPYEDLLAKSSAGLCPVEVCETDIFSIPYTSGATGRPKGVLLSHRSRVLSAFCLATEHGSYTPDDRAVATTPMFHGAGLLMALAPVFFGGTVEILGKFNIETLLAAITRLQATSAYMVPTHLAALRNLGSKASQFDTRSLRTVASGTAPLSQALKEEAIAYFGAGKLYERYGSTEAGVTSCLRPQDQLRKIACVGLPLPLTRLKVMTGDGRQAGTDEVGELAIASPYMFSGYLNLLEQTAQSFRDGWFISGDLARIDEEGYLYLVDRKNDMIISGGENIYPREIEEVLLAHPAVAECAVTSVPHTYWGEAVAAFVGLRQGAAVSADELAAVCRDKLSRYKVPKEFIFVEKLPRNSMGKVLRRELRDLLPPERNAS